MAKSVLVVLAEGFEETEAIVPMDLLKRSGSCVTIAGLSSINVKSSHNITITADCLLSDVIDNDFDAIVLPGGMPGADNLASSKALSDKIISMNEKKKYICAICASPAVVLGKLDVLDGKRAVCYPGFEKYSPSVNFENSQVVTSKNVITARGAGCSVEFGLEIICALYDRDTADKIALSIMY